MDAEFGFNSARARLALVSPRLHRAGSRSAAPLYLRVHLFGALARSPARESVPLFAGLRDILSRSQKQLRGRTKSSTQRVLGQPFPPYRLYLDRPTNAGCSITPATRWRVPDGAFVSIHALAKSAPGVAKEPEGHEEEWRGWMARYNWHRGSTSEVSCASASSLLNRLRPKRLLNAYMRACPAAAAA